MNCDSYLSLLNRSLWVIQFLFYFSLSGLLFSCSSGKNNKQEEKSFASENDLPSMPITYLNGSQQSAKTLTGKVMLVLFQPDCDHCQREAEQIEKNLEAFKDYNIYFISSNPMNQIEKFSVDYNLNNKPNVFFAWTATENVINNFGPIAAPSVYIYSDDGKLVESFNGEVAIEVLLKYI